MFGDHRHAFVLFINASIEAVSMHYMLVVVVRYVQLILRTYFGWLEKGAVQLTLTLGVGFDHVPGTRALVRAP